MELRSKRERKGVTLADISKATGIPYVTLWRYETGATEPRAGELKKIADVLGVTTDELLKDNSECD